MDDKKTNNDESGEQSISGETPTPESDNDLLSEVHDVGEQLGEDEEHPKEVNIGRDVNNAEEYQKDH